jgi:4-hydroxy-2-oxoglutarate aldolase
LLRHYERVAEEVAVPVLIYNAPQFAGGVQVPPQTVIQLSQFPGVVGIKDSSPGGPARFIADLDPEADFSVLAGSMNTFYTSLHMGAAGGVLSLANVVPDRCVELYELFTQGQYDRARELSNALIRLNQTISGTWGVAGVKAAMDLIGLMGGQPRGPLAPASTEAIGRIREALVNEGYVVPSGM